MSIKSAIILAGGKGTRMKSQKPKVLSEILFKPMLGHVLDHCKESGILDICVVTGYKSELVEEYIDNYAKNNKLNVTTALQSEQKGTGHAVMMALDFLKENSNSDVVVLCGDAPFVDADTIKEAYNSHKEKENAVTVITADIEKPQGYGRIIRKHGKVTAIVEQKDCTDEQAKVSEINSGAFWFKSSVLIETLDKLTPNNSQGEYYLTDTLSIALKSNERVDSFIAKNSDVVLGANSRKDLYNLSEKMRLSVIDKLFDLGVEFVSTDGVCICADAVIGADTKILGGTIIKEGVVIGSDCVIGPNTLISDSSIGDRVVLNSTQCYQSKIHSDVEIGPFVHIRPNSEIKSFVHIGDFVEVKNSTIGEGTGISHLTYIGDSDVGKNINFGCGVVTVNYDGVNKNRCVIEDDAFVGCNTNLVAPVHVGKGAYIAAGSTITADIPSEALGIARSRQTIKKDFAKKKLEGRKKKFNG